MKTAPKPDTTCQIQVAVDKFDTVLRYFQFLGSAIQLSKYRNIGRVEVRGFGQRNDLVMVLPGYSLLFL